MFMLLLATIEQQINDPSPIANAMQYHLSHELSTVLTFKKSPELELKLMHQPHIATGCS